MIDALSELKKEQPDIARIKEGLLFLDGTTGKDIRKELRTLLENALENKPHKYI